MNCFTDKNVIPKDDILKDILGKVFCYYEELLSTTKVYCKQWSYTKSAGWILKIHDKKKALCYFTPMENEYKIGLTVRENERLELLDNAKGSFLHNSLESAQRLSEGYPLYFIVMDGESARQCIDTLEEIMALRNKK